MLHWYGVTVTGESLYLISRGACKLTYKRMLNIFLSTSLSSRFANIWNLALINLAFIYWWCRFLFLARPVNIWNFAWIKLASIYWWCHFPSLSRPVNIWKLAWINSAFICWWQMMFALPGYILNNKHLLFFFRKESYFCFD